MRKSSAKPIDLSPERIAILLALAHTPADAPRVLDQVVADTVGALYISKASLYRHLKALVAQGYLSVSGDYDLTPKGWQTLERHRHQTERQSQLLKIRLSPRQYLAAQR